MTDIGNQEAQALEGRKVQKILVLGLEDIGIRLQKMVLAKRLPPTPALQIKAWETD